MSRQVPYFAGVADDAALVGLAQSRGLHLVCMRYSFHPPPADPGEYPACYLSIHPRELLRAQGDPPRVADVLDPMLELTRAFVEGKVLVAGRLCWNDDDEVLAEETLPYFRRVSSWIRRHWRKRPEDGYYIGPQADHLLREGFQTSYLPRRVSMSRSSGASHG